MQTTFNFHLDDGHEWIEVPRAIIDLLGIANKISNYSHQSNDGSTVYVESDCDAPEFYDAFHKFFGVYAKFNDLYEAESFVRKLPRFKI